MAVCSVGGCNREAVLDTEVCDHHGGLSPHVIRAADMRAAEQALDAWVQPVSRLDPEADPVVGLQAEYQRTLAKVRHLEAAVARLTQDQATWVKSKHETAGGYEGMPNTTYEAKPHVLLDLLERERRNLARLGDVLLRDKFRAAEAIRREQIEAFMSQYVEGLTLALRRDPNAEHVRAALSKFLLDPAGETERLREKQRTRALAPKAPPTTNPTRKNRTDR